MENIQKNLFSWQEIYESPNRFGIYYLQTEAKYIIKFRCSKKLEG